MRFAGLRGGHFRGRGGGGRSGEQAGGRRREWERDGRAKIALARRRPMPDGVTSREGGKYVRERE